MLQILSATKFKSRFPAPTESNQINRYCSQLYTSSTSRWPPPTPNQKSYYSFFTNIKASKMTKSTVSKPSKTVGTLTLQRTKQITNFKALKMAKTTFSKLSNTRNPDFAEYENDNPWHWLTQSVRELLQPVLGETQVCQPHHPTDLLWQHLQLVLRHIQDGQLTQVANLLKHHHRHHPTAGSPTCPGWAAHAGCQSPKTSWSSLWSSSSSSSYSWFSNMFKVDSLIFIIIMQLVIQHVQGGRILQAGNLLRHRDHDHYHLRHYLWMF